MAKHKALLVGINRYLSTKIPELKGSINDVSEMAELLYRFGFDTGDIRIITDERATKENIVMELDWLGEKVGKDDRLLFYFAGYGSHVGPTPNEVLCTYDFDFDFKKTLHLSSTDFERKFSGSKTNYELQIILDVGFSKPNVSSDMQYCCTACDKIRNVRYLEPPLDIYFHVEHNPYPYFGKFLRPPGLSGPKKAILSLSKSASLALWLASGENQPCYEAELGSVHGVFTNIYCKVIRQTGPNISRERLQVMVNQAIQEAGFNQTPFLSTSSEDRRQVSAFNGNVHPWNGGG